MAYAVALTIARLPGEEGRKKYAYNDATGERVTCRPNGNLTIAIGCNLEEGLYDAEINFITRNRVEIAANSLVDYWWFKVLDDVRASVFVDLCFNEGLPHLLGFVKTLAAAGDGNWQEAHDQLLNSDASRKDPHRYVPLAEILLTGVN